MSKEIQIVGRIICNSFVDFQLVRIGMLNKVRDVIRKKVEGIAFDAVEEKKDKKDYKKKYTDEQLLKQWEELRDKKKITEKEYDYVIVCFEFAKDSTKLENKMKRMMMEYVKTEPVYKEFLSLVKGIGPVISANLIKEFGNCEKYATVSKLWKHTGNHVEDGKAVKLRKGKTIDFNPSLRTFTWKIGDCLMKANKGFYRSIYDTEKKKQLSRTYKPGELKEKYEEKGVKNAYKEEDIKLILGHAHNRALRKMRKIFLSHYWTAARELAGLSTERTYVEGVLEHTHIVSWREALKKEKPKGE